MNLNLRTPIMEHPVTTITRGGSLGAFSKPLPQSKLTNIRGHSQNHSFSISLKHHSCNLKFIPGENFRKDKAAGFITMFTYFLYCQIEGIITYYM